MSLTQEVIWAEMARRKLQFHRNKNWNKIELWGLFKWRDVKSLLDKGLLITKNEQKNIIIWVKPSKEGWERKILPLINKYSLEELTKMAG